MARKVSKARFLAVAAAPKRRYRSFVISDGSRARLGGPVASPCYWFERRRETIDVDGAHTIENRDSTVTLVVDGTPSVLFYLEGPRVVSCTFTFNLAPYQLTSAVLAMGRAKLKKFIPEAALSALENIPSERRVIVETELRRLAASTPPERPDRR